MLSLQYTPTVSRKDVRRPAPSAAEWESHKPQIERLYYSTSLDHLVREMEGVGFFATQAMYKSRFRLWGWRKYITRELAVEADKKRTRSEEEGSPTSIVMHNGKEVPNSRIKRHMKKYKADFRQRQRVSASVHAESSLAASRVVVTTPINHTTSPTAVTTAQTLEYGSISYFDPVLSQHAQIARLAPQQTPIRMAYTSPILSSDVDGASLVSSPGFYNYYPSNDLSRVTPNVNLTGYGIPPSGVENYSNMTYQSSPSSLVPLQDLPKTCQPIHHAAQRGYIKIVKLLLKFKPECADLEGENGKTPLFLAAQEGHTEVVEALLAAGANPNTFDRKNQRSCIHQAARGGHVECVRLLLSKDASTDGMDINGATPFKLACEEGFFDVARLILSERRQAGYFLETWSLHLAAQLGNLMAVQFHIAIGASVNEAVEGCATPLWLACFHGHLDVVKLLVNGGAAVNDALSSSQRQPIYQAPENGHPRLMQSLHSRDANIVRRELKGASPLWIASQKGHTKIVKFLLEHKASPGPRTLEPPSYLYPDAANSHQVEAAWPPLIIAAQEGHLGIAEMLLNEGAKPAVRSSSGMQPIHQAAENGHLEMVRLLVAWGSDADCQCPGRGGLNITPLWLASQGGHDAIVEFLLEKGASPLVS